MRHIRAGWWTRLVDDHPKIPDALAVAAIIVCLLAGLVLLLWLATAKIKGLG